MKRTFADLNAPFSLFSAPIEDATEYVGDGRCSLCGREADPCFELGIGAAVMVACPKCGAENGMDADDREEQGCVSCGSSIPFPIESEEDILTCYSCLRSGKAAITSDTELGAVFWEVAAEGRTHGVPGLNHPDFEMVETDSGWVQARVEKEHLYELLRTPNYSTIQGEVWQFCCKRPMTYVGTWRQADFDLHASDGNGRALFDQIVQDPTPEL